MRVLPGKPFPLGPTWDGLGVNFSLFSEHAEKVELCLFDSIDARRESHRIPLPECSYHVWHGYFPDLRTGQLFGYRVYGPYQPGEGHRFNPSKVLTDPYAKAVVRRTRWHDSMFGYKVGHEDEDLSFDDRDNAAFAPLSSVVQHAYDWGDDRSPGHAWNETVIYEAHIKGLTERHPEVPAELRGTYAGLACEPVLRHLRELGVTAVELMPVHHRIDDRHLTELGLNNYWGYNTLSYFSPDYRYVSPLGRNDPVGEFKMMVRALHSAGLEVILDVVYNHTGEGNHLGPTLSLRGIDNRTYYRLMPDNPRYYMDFTGTGNTLNMQQPQVLRLIMDSLRYWILEMHVDGFRFDLASALARELYEVDKLGSFFDIIHQDPVISRVKLIAEPWDLGEGGYQVGQFPVLWTEWNGKYRDAVRRFWTGQESSTGEFATRISGSSDLYQGSGRGPHASINFVTCHDGFTLRDLVSYNQKHNEANGEENRDGNPHNYSMNFGEEGPTDRADISEIRRRQMRNYMATLMFSVGVPMISGGDELSRTQLGNNNAYCQDNEISWYDWESDDDRDRFLAFVKRVVRIRREQPVFRRRSFFEGGTGDGGAKDIYWLTPGGGEMTQENWTRNERIFGVLLTGGALREPDARGQWQGGDDVLLLFNAGEENVLFRMPSRGIALRWERLLDTSIEDLERIRRRSWRRREAYALTERSMAVFRGSQRAALPRERIQAR